MSDGKKVKERLGDVQVNELTKISTIGIGIIVAVNVSNVNGVIQTLKETKAISMKDVYVQKIYSGFPWEFRNMSVVNDNSLTNGEYFEKYTQLDDLGKKYGTDKNSDYNNYCKYYEFFLNDFKERYINVLELGIYKGSSINMWNEFFVNAHIYGVDINESCKKYENGKKHVIIKNLSDEKEICSLKELSPSIIIDDASHIWSHQIKALYHLLPCLPSGGIYILEDLATSFSSFGGAYSDANISTYEFLLLLQERVTSGMELYGRKIGDPMAYCADEIEFLSNKIDMMSFVMGSCIIVRK